MSIHFRNVSSFSALKVKIPQEILLFELVTPVLWFVLHIQAA